MEQSDHSDPEPVPTTSGGTPAAEGEGDDAAACFDMTGYSPNYDETEEMLFEVNVDVSPDAVPLNLNQVDPDTLRMSVEEYVASHRNENTAKAERHAVNLFNTVMKIRSQQNGESFRPFDDLEVDELPDAISKCFLSAMKRDGTPYNAGSLKTIFGALTRHLNTRTTGPRVDVMTDLRFKECRKVLTLRQTAVSLAGQRPGINSALPVPKEVRDAMFQGGHIGRDGPRELIRNVHWIFTTQFGSRCRQECRNVKFQDVMFGPEHPQYKVPQYVDLSERITKTRKGLDYSVRDVPSRAFADHQNPLQCPVRTLKLYERKKDPKMNKDDAAYFLTCSQPAIRNPDCTDVWFTQGPMGVNYIGNLLTDAVRAAGYDPKKYKITANSTRKTLATVACSAGVPGPHISKKMGHKNLNSALGYLKVDEESQRATGLALSRTLEGLPNSGFQEILDDGKGSNAPNSVHGMTPTPVGNQNPMMTAPAPQNPMMTAPAPQNPMMTAPAPMFNPPMMMVPPMMMAPPMMAPMMPQMMTLSPQMVMTSPQMMGAPMVQMMTAAGSMMMSPQPMMQAAMTPPSTMATPAVGTMLSATPASSTVSQTATGSLATTALADITNTKRESKNNYKGAKSSKKSAESVDLKVTFVRNTENNYSLK